MYAFILFCAVRNRSMALSVYTKDLWCTLKSANSIPYKLSQSFFLVRRSTSVVETFARVGEICITETFGPTDYDNNCDRDKINQIK